MIELRSYRTHAGQKTVLVSDHGSKYLHVLIMDGAGLALRQVTKAEARYMAEPIQNGRPKARATVLRQFAQYGRAHGATRAAKQFLTKARNEHDQDRETNRGANTRHQRPEPEQLPCNY